VFAASDRLVVGRHGQGPAWPVANYEGHGFGHATLRSATALSINTVYAGLLVRLGGGDADRGRGHVRAAARLGVASRLRAVPSAVLGTNEVTPLEMAGAYATLAAGGRRAAPFGVRRITGPDGRVLYQARPEGDQVLAPGVAAIATDVLREVVDHGTGVRPGSAGRRPARPAPPRTMPTPGSWASPRPWPRPWGRLPAGPGDGGRRGGAGDGAGPVAGRRDRPAGGDAGHLTVAVDAQGAGGLG
jgi:membrane peptidoglycan carboxypeptidase